MSALNCPRCNWHAAASRYGQRKAIIAKFREPTFVELYTPKLITTLLGRYQFADLKADAIAGLTVAIVALPLSMAIESARNPSACGIARRFLQCVGVSGPGDAPGGRRWQAA
jgi:hypothetical protein